MLFYPILFISLLGIAIDWWHLHRLHRRSPQQHYRLLGAWIVITDLIPFVVMGITLYTRDNTPTIMTLTMWLFMGWMLAVPPRLACYLFRLIGLPRTGLWIAILLIVVFIGGATIGRSRLIVNRVEICSPRVPDAFSGFKIVQLSDMHIGTLVRRERELTRLVDRVNALHPDVVIFTGDLVNIRASELDKKTIRLLQRIQAPVYSVTGNHDIGTYIKDSITTPAAVSLRELLDRQQQMGWRMLNDTTSYLRRGNDSIALSGIAFDPALRDRRHDRHLPADHLGKTYAGVPASLFNITAVHLPQLWDQILATGYGDLTLSGHVHAMQFKIQPWGRGWSPAAWFYPRWSGRYDQQGRTLYINDGTGYVGYPMRLGAWPEITLFTLKRCE